MLTIWGRTNSHNVKKVLWLAEELGLPYVRHDVGGQFGMDAAYRAKNPNALIPTIDDGDLSLWESNAILRYLGARYGAGRYWRNDPAERAVGDKWMDWQLSFAPLFVDAFKGLIRTAPEDRDEAAIAASAAHSGKAMAILDGALADNAWLSGTEIGLGDLPMGVYAYSYYSLPIARPELPNLRAWYERLIERPAYRATVMIPLS